MQLEVPILKKKQKRELNENDIINLKNEISIPIFVNELESNYSVWNRLKKMYLPEMSEINIHYKEQLYYKLCNESKIEILLQTGHLFEETEIVNQALFYAKYPSKYYLFDLIVNNIYSSLEASPNQPMITKTNRLKQFALFNTSMEEKEFLSEAILEIKQKTSSLLSSSSSKGLPITSNEDVISTVSNEPDSQIKSKEDIQSIRISNLCNQIYKYQMTIIANSISSIKANKSSGYYLISFDPCINIPDLCLKSAEYEELIRHKDLLTFNHLEPNHNITKINRKNSDEITITNYDLIQFHFCHQCKLRKEEGKYCSNKDCKRIVTELSINDLHLFITKDGIYVIDYSQNDYLLQVIINHLSKRNSSQTIKCDRFFCADCIKLSNPSETYNIIKTFICSSCSKNCNCITCQYEIQLCKSVAYYLSLQWDIDYLYKYCIEKFPLLSNHKDQLMLSKCILCKFNEEKQMKRRRGKRKSNKKLIKEANQHQHDIIRYQQTIGDYFSNIDITKTLLQKRLKKKMVFNSNKTKEQ